MIDIRFVMVLVLWIHVVSCAEQPRLRMFDVSGHQMRVQTAGLNYDRNQPTILFEAGGGMSLETWNKVFPAVAQFASVIAYDRSGIGRSDWDGQRPTLKHVVENLHLLLTEVREKPPYVLVGHSIGGIFIKTFAALHPQEVAGLVFVDGSPILSEQDELEMDTAMGLSASDLLANRDRERKKWHEFAFAGISTPALKAELEVAEEMRWGNLFAEFRSLPPTPQVPIAVLMSATPKM